MSNRPSFSWLGVLLCAALAASSCGHVDLKATLDVTDMQTGYYDAGNIEGKVHLVPSLTFRLHNKSGQSVNAVQLTISFWRTGDDGEYDSIEVRGIGSTDLAAGASTDPIVARANHGYNLEGARADFFSHSLFRDVTAKVFALRGGDIVPMGEFKLDRRIITHELVEK
jgi:hypothetical protein